MNQRAEMATNRPRKQSFLTITGEREDKKFQQVQSRLPASQMDPASNLIDLTPSGEVQMRVIERESRSEHSTPRLVEKQEIKMS